MKKILFILLFILFIPVVKAETIDRFYQGDGALNGDVIRFGYGLNDTNGYMLDVSYYDGDEVVCSEEVAYTRDEGFTVNCDKGDLWILSYSVNTTLEFKKLDVKEGATVHRLVDSFYAHGYIEEILNKGDILLYYDEPFASFLYPYEEYYFDFAESSPGYYTGNILDGSYIIVGYEAPDWTKEIEGSQDSYILADYQFNASRIDTFTFVPYKEPEFSIRCDKNLLKKGEETDCYIEMETNVKFEEIAFHLTSKLLEIKESTNISEKYDLEEGDNNYYHFTLIDKYDDLYNSSFLARAEAVIVGKPFTEPLLKVRVVAKEDIETTEVLGASDIVYNVLFVEGNSIVDYKFINDQKEEEPAPVKNPKTANNIIIAIIIAIVTLEILAYLKSKKITYDI